jgi:hypothetical protein
MEQEYVPVEARVRAMAEDLDTIIGMMARLMEDELEDPVCGYPADAPSKQEMPSLKKAMLALGYAYNQLGEVAHAYERKVLKQRRDYTGF